MHTCLYVHNVLIYVLHNSVLNVLSDNIQFIQPLYVWQIVPHL